MKEKTISIILALALCFALEVSAFAARDTDIYVTWTDSLELNAVEEPRVPENNVSGTMPFPDVAASSKYYEAVNYVNGVGLMVGDNNGYFNPGNPVTRAEMAIVICRMLGVTVSNSASFKFVDVPESHWANRYIGMAADLGIVSGYGNGRFGPSDYVTYGQAVTMVVRALGESDKAASRGGFPDGFLSIASDLGLLSGIQSAKNANFSRGNVALLLFNWGKNGSGKDEGSNGSNEGITIPDKNQGYIIDLCPPYQKDGLNTPATVNMAGQSYTYCLSFGYVLDGWNAYGGWALFNLDGKYNTLSFDAGHIDGGPMHKTTISIYLDGQLATAFDLDQEGLPKHYDIPLNGALQMKIEGSNNFHTLANAIIS